MSIQLTPIARCQEIAGLGPHEIMLGAVPGEKHERLLARYCRNRRSAALARTAIVADIRAAVTDGATREAADLLIVLRRLLSQPASSRRPPCARRPLGRRRHGRAVALAQH
ncbi:polysaccharide deacetylase [Methylocystis echinoides]|jgi:hypothetical protein|uniref:polysaccharide deacetylase n=1 Tax=Methylocystis echinoides TaxID=29468 RepID=UPI003436E37F